MILKNAVAVWIGLLVFALAPAASQGRPGLPLFFVPNRGQAPAPVRYLLRSAELSAYFTPAETRLDLQGEMLGIRFAGASANPRLEPLELLPGQVNYLIGNSKANWQTGLPAYGALAYRGLYPGVDLIYGAEDGRLKSEFRLAPGVDPGLIRWFYEGASAPRGDGQGGLIAATPGGELRERKPALYQEIGGRRIPVAGSFRFFADGSVGFQTESYDQGRPLVIDPILSYSTYLGGGGLDSANAIAVDAAGNAYVAGHTDSLNFPTANPLRSRGGGVDAFVAKLNPAGNGLIYCTYFGGSGDDRAFGITVDGSGNAYLTGWTYSTNFPVTSGSRQPVLGGGRDAFVAQLNPSGSALLYSTYLGGSGHDSGNAIAVDAAGNAYIAGDTYSTNLPVMNALQGSNSGRQDAFVAKLNATGSSLVWSTYLGGYGDERAAALALDLAGNVYLTGGTTSTNFPTYRAIQAANGGGTGRFCRRPRRRRPDAAVQHLPRRQRRHNRRRRGGDGNRPRRGRQHLRRRLHQLEELPHGEPAAGRARGRGRRRVCRQAEPLRRRAALQHIPGRRGRRLRQRRRGYHRGRRGRGRLYFLLQLPGGRCAATRQVRRL